MMTLICVGAHKTGAYAFMAGDTKAIGPRGAVSVPKVFMHPNGTIVASAGHASSILVAIDVCLSNSVAFDEVGVSLFKLWNDYCNQYFRFFTTQDKQSSQYFYLLRQCDKDRFLYTTLIIPFGQKAYPRELELCRANALVFGPEFDINDRTIHEYERTCRPRITNALKDNVVSAKRLQAGVSFAVKLATEVPRPASALVGLPVLGWMLWNDGRFEPFGESVGIDPELTLSDQRDEILRRLEWSTA